MRLFLLFQFFLYGSAQVSTVYPIVTSGTCASNGYEVIEDTMTCENAANITGWSDTDAVTRAIFTSYPQGCQDWNSSSSGGDEDSD